MFQIKIDSQFVKDYAAFRRRYPYLVAELQSAIDELAQNGKVSSGYRPHPLNNPGGNYNGHIDFHLSDGEVDVVVLYLPHKSNPVIRLVRIGEHAQLFQGPLQ
ncbi:MULTISPECIES: type II toxin-antitoxin system YafQ family toxin [unclassified Bifidobacterium]|uniref:type II toxin-antitoxin system YafQ family toxin n=1 Tax=unclassified Bifidobacterium TaxID=2608897 RepID=UPI0023F918DF|nr:MULTISPECIES: type II toxin-antitoxin system YafQ family toxin [unclassified Bifidobacterium]WEV65845.1 type II toxin-antitoxin system YafQ family toxin [Bifidobacterium sp. ESL0764]WEV75368.1 type II toxin-antitoxin system YafQ family toxin [Bifidobacterium sp. ESL0800]